MPSTNPEHIVSNRRTGEGMSEHSIKELKRQMDDAKSRVTSADLDYRAANKRYHDALVRESGLMGNVVKSARYAILVQDVGFSGGRPWRAAGFRINKDGKAGFASGSVYLDEPHEVLPYEHGTA